jgi:hypothetical protein
MVQDGIIEIGSLLWKFQTSIGGKIHGFFTGSLAIILSFRFDKTGADGLVKQLHCVYSVSLPGLRPESTAFAILQ